MADSMQQPVIAAPAPKILNRSDRKIAHAEANKKLWDAAERPERSYFLETKNEVPLKDEFKPQVKVLSRKPTAPATSSTKGLAGLSLADEDDSEEEERRRAAETFAERQARAVKEREEKQRKYAEARERIMGSSARPNSGSNSRQSSRAGPGQGKSGSRQNSSAEQSPARGPAYQARALYDPLASAKPADGRPSPRSGTPNLEQPVRMPRGPDASGRGGFAQRGGRTG